VPNPEWYELFGVNYRAIASWARLGTLLAVIWLTIVIAGLVFAPGSAALAFSALLAALGAVTCLTIHAVLRRRITRQGMRYLRGVAAEARGDHLIRLYQRYLWDSA
jgi:hypothetical protein